MKYIVELTLTDPMGEEFSQRYSVGPDYFNKTKRVFSLLLDDLISKISDNGAEVTKEWTIASEILEFVKPN